MLLVPGLSISGCCRISNPDIRCPQAIRYLPLISKYVIYIHISYQTTIMRKIIVLLNLLFISLTSFGQWQDVENCKDHPMFNRLPNYLINGCSENFAAFELQIAEEKHQTLEGNLTHIQYTFNPEVQAKHP